MREKIIKVLYLVLSLLMAVALWLYVDAEQGSTISKTLYDIPVEFLGADDTLFNRNLMLTGGQDATLDVTISGSRFIVPDLEAEDFRAVVDLSYITSQGPYSCSYTIVPPDSVSEGSIRYDHFSRSTVTVQVGPMYARKVPVGVSVTGAVPEGYIYMADLLVAQPSELTLRGMADDVDQVASARVVVDLTDARSTIQRSFDYELLDADGNVVDNTDGRIRISDRQVEVVAPIYITKTLPLTVRVKESSGSLEEYFAISQDLESIQLAGEPASLETMDEILLGEVDLRTILSDVTILFNIPIPAGCICFDNVSDVHFSVRQRTPLEIRTFSVTNIQAVGLSDTQEFSRLTSSIDVQVRGPAGSLDELTEDNVRIVVDLTEYADNGTYSVPAIVLVDGNREVGAIGTYTVACKISTRGQGQEPAQ